MAQLIMNNISSDSFIQSFKYIDIATGLTSNTHSYTKLRTPMTQKINCTFIFMNDESNSWNMRTKF